jgi:hypothetical protein
MVEGFRGPFRRAPGDGPGHRSWCGVALSCGRRQLPCGWRCRLCDVFLSRPSWEASFAETGASDCSRPRLLRDVDHTDVASADNSTGHRSDDRTALDRRRSAPSARGRCGGFSRTANARGPKDYTGAEQARRVRRRRHPRGVGARRCGGDAPSSFELPGSARKYSPFDLTDPERSPIGVSDAAADGLGEVDRARVAGDAAGHLVHHVPVTDPGLRIGVAE